MDFERSFSRTSATFIILVILISATSVVLLERLAYSAKEVVQTNAYSVKATQEMLALLAGDSSPASSAFQQGFQKAMIEAEAHISHEGEKGLLTVIREQYQVLRLEPDNQRVRMVLVRSISELSQVNRIAMIEADESVSFFSIAGGWAIVGLTLVGYLIGRMSLTNLNKGALQPMAEICVVLNDWEAGNNLRRINTSRVTGDMRRSQEIINRLLDGVGNRRI